jgi:chemotaxis protein MotA
MLAIAGILVVFVSVIVGFTIAGGQLLVLLQPAEFILIGGAAFGSLLIMTTPSQLKKIFSVVPSIFSHSAPTKQDYLELLKSFNDLFLIAQRDGVMAIEKHIEDPKSSEILSRSKKFIHNKHAVDLFCDTMKVIITAGIQPHDLEALIDAEIESFEAEMKPIGHTITKIADSFPGLGIVAAVLGVIITMGSVDEGAAAVGHHVAAALVGTFLGVLLCYGLVGPIGANIEHSTESEVQYLETIKTAIIAYIKGNPPVIVVEMARRTISPENRPTFQELENYIRGK